MTPELTAFLQIIVIDIVMSGDNAIIIGMAAAGLPPELRKKAIFWGIIGATVLRIFFALIVVQLLSITGIKVIGGLLLLWVCWRMWQEIRAGTTVEDIEREVEENAKNRPVSKVITLLKDMQAQLEKEGEEDEEDYDRMVCWCETNEKEKTKVGIIGK